jgi:hypothetical protein
MFNPFIAIRDLRLQGHPRGRLPTGSATGLTALRRGGARAAA